MERYEKIQAKPSQKIYLSNLTMDTQQSDLRKAFENFGTIVDINLKSKNNGIVFAFIEFDSTQSAQKAVDGMNKTTFMDKEIKVEFALGRRDTDRGFRPDRGGDRGDRGDRGFRGRGDFDRRRDERPRGCFNCGEEGHFIRECPKPKQPREPMRDGRGDRDRDGRRSDYRGDRRDRDRSRDDRKYKKKSRSRSSSSESRSRDQKKRSRKNKSRSSGSSSN